MQDHTLDRPTGKVTFRIPTTVRDWELYSGPGASRAARSMTAALKRSFRAFPNLLKDLPIPRALAQAAAIPNGINDAMGKYAEFGAYDTEPRYHAHQALINFAKAHCLGTTEGYHSEFGDWL